MSRTLSAIAALFLIAASASPAAAKTRAGDIDVSGLKIGMDESEVRTILEGRGYKVVRKGTAITASDQKRGKGASVTYFVIFTENYGNHSYSDKVWKIRLKQRFKSPLTLAKMTDDSVQRFGNKRFRAMKGALTWDYGSGRTLVIDLTTPNGRKAVTGFNLTFQDEKFRNTSKNAVAELHKRRQVKKKEKRAAAKRKKKEALKDKPVF